MNVSTRKFLRDFPQFRQRAERGETVVIESRDGTKFFFHRIGAAPRPRQVKEPLPQEVTDRWDPDGPGVAPDEWEMNR